MKEGNGEKPQINVLGQTLEQKLVSLREEHPQAVSDAERVFTLSLKGPREGERLILERRLITQGVEGFALAIKAFMDDSEAGVIFEKYHQADEDEKVSFEEAFKLFQLRFMALPQTERKRLLGL